MALADSIVETVTRKKIPLGTNQNIDKKKMKEAESA